MAVGERRAAMRLAVAAAAGLALIAVLGAGVMTAPGANGNLAQRVAEALTCQCGCGLTVANCNHPNCMFSVPARKKIAAMVGRGMTYAQIIDFFRRKYGRKILSAPTTTGFDLLAWIIPFVGIGLGGLVILIAAGRWRARTSAQEATEKPPPVSETADDSRLRERLEKELRERF